MIIGPKARAIVHQLLAHHGITHYIIDAMPEGQTLSGSTNEEKISSMSGSIITPTTVYSFWFDWENGAYTLGENNGMWEEFEESEWNDAEEKAFHGMQRRLLETPS